MKTLSTLAIVLAAGLTCAVLAADDGYVSVPAIPSDTGEAVQNVLYARTVHMESPYTYYWCAEQPKITTCTLLVLEVDPDFARPRQVGVPVLYVGDTPVELTNTGYVSGRMIVFVPGEVDLTRTPIYFGSTELPERVDANRGALEQAAAEEMGIAPFSPEVIATARETGGEDLHVGDANYLYLECANLIRTYAIDEVEMADIYELYFVR